MAAPTAAHPLVPVERRPVRHRTRPMHRLVVPLLALALAALAPAPARAHDVLVGTEPSDGAVVAGAPSQVVLAFSAAPLDVGVAVTVTGPDGGEWADGAPLVDADRVVQPVRAGMPAGSYAVQWRAVSGDGHPVTGAFGFEVAPAEPQAAATPQDGPTAAAPSAEPEEPEEPVEGRGSPDPAGAAAGSDGGTGAGTDEGTRSGSAALVAVGAVTAAALVAAAAWLAGRRSRRG